MSRDTRALCPGTRHPLRHYKARNPTRPLSCGTEQRGADLVPFGPNRSGSAHEEAPERSRGPSSCKGVIRLREPGEGLLTLREHALVDGLERFGQEPVEQASPWQVPHSGEVSRGHATTSRRRLRRTFGIPAMPRAHRHLGDGRFLWSC
jgi:hypothetical protein